MTRRPTSVELLSAIYAFTADYHSGQWSRGYRIMCVAQRALKRRLGHPANLGLIQVRLREYPGSPMGRAYWRLITNYQDEV